jgi:hypothetical protein
LTPLSLDTENGATFTPSRSTARIVVIDDDPDVRVLVGGNAT